MKFQSQRGVLEDKRNTVIINNSNSASRITEVRSPSVQPAPAEGATAASGVNYFFHVQKRKKGNELNVQHMKLDNGKKKNLNF